MTAEAGVAAGVVGTVEGGEGGLSDEQRVSWEERGFFRIDGFAPASTCEAMLARVTEIVRDPALAASLRVKVMAESNKAGVAVEHPEDGVSKIFRLHRDPVFAEFAHSAAVVDVVAPLIADDVDVFLSQFIFKTSGAWGSRGTRTPCTSRSSRAAPWWACGSP